MDQICPKRKFPVKKSKTEHHHQTLHIWISLGIKLQPKLRILSFWTKFALKGYFPFKTEEVNIAIEFFIFELVYVPNFSLNWQFCVFGPDFPKKGYFQSKVEELNITIEFSIFELVLGPNFSLNWQFWFFGPHLPKKGVSDWKQKKWTWPLNSSYTN